MAESMDIGKKIKSLRIRNRLTQQELADRCELSKGFISQVENNATSPSIATLQDILEILGTDFKNFFNYDVEEKIVFKSDDFFEKENDELRSNIKWIVPNAQKRMMEPILIEIRPGGRTEVDMPHEGEEFGFLLSGSAVIRIGSHSIKVKKGESFYFKPNIEHYIENKASASVLILWIITPPSF